MPSSNGSAFANADSIAAILENMIYWVTDFLFVISKNQKTEPQGIMSHNLSPHSLAPLYFSWAKFSVS